MIYDFAAKIANIKNEEMFEAENIGEGLAVLHTKVEKPLDIKIMMSDDVYSSRTILVKAQISVSTMPSFHDRELDEAVEQFISYLEEIAKMIRGEIRKEEGFYNNSKVFKRLFDI